MRAIPIPSAPGAGQGPRRRRRPRLAVAALLLASALPLPAQELPIPEATVGAGRPRIGLALSGGGARGAAQIGVLKVLEELRVPIDCIAGTSMGAVVGGAYAAGVSPQEMERVIAQTDWADVFVDRPPRAEIATRRKQDDYRNLFAPEYGVRDGSLLLPKGVIAGVTIENFLRRLSAPAGGTSDFDRLPIPYRAVATDIETGEEVVLARGSLMRAMRASMAIPGALTPVAIDGRLLVDGGIADNLPIDVVRRLCADVVIAVDIGTPPLSREQLHSALSIVGQLASFLGKASVDRQLAGLTGGDVLVAPALGDLSSIGFDRQREAIAHGEAAARSMAAALARYAVGAAEYAAFRRRGERTETTLGSVDEIRFEGIERTNPEVLTDMMRSRAGDELTHAQLDADMRRIYGRGDFEAVDYRIERGPGRSVLVVTVREKTIGPDYLRFGLGLASDFAGESTFNALASYRRAWLNRLGGEWLVEAQIGREHYLFTEFYQPLHERGRFFVAPYAQLGQYTRGVYARDRRVAEYRIREWRGGLDLGATLGTSAEVRVGPLLRRIEARTHTGSPILPSLDATTSGLRLRVFADRHDAPWFPRSGYRGVLSAFATSDALGADDRYRRLEGLWTAATSVREHTFAATLYGGSRLGSSLPAYELFSLGGPFRLSGYRIGQFAGQSLAFASLRYYDRIHQLPSLLGSGIYVGGSLEVGRVQRLIDGRESSGTRHSASVYLGAETFLGPAFLGVGLAEGGRQTLFLVLGVP